MSNPWFRMYHEFATDPKVQMLSESDQRRFVMLLCLRCSNGDVTLQDDEIAFQLRVSNDDWAQTKAVLMGKGLIDEDGKPCAWEKRQFASDSSAARVRKHREKKKRACNVTETKSNATDTDTDTDTENKAPSGKPADALPGQGEKPKGQKSNPVTLKTYLENLKASGEKPFREDDPIHDYAEGIGLPHDFLAVCWFEFQERYKAESKKYRDWRSVFRKAVRGNWFKLWYLDPASGQYGLTTPGIQAERNMKSRRAA